MIQKEAMFFNKSSCQMVKQFSSSSHNFQVSEFFILSETDNLTFTPSSCNGWSAVWRSDSRCLSQKLTFFILYATTADTFHMNNQVQHYECLPGETVTKWTYIKADASNIDDCLYCVSICSKQKHSCSFWELSSYSCFEFFRAEMAFE